MPPRNRPRSTTSSGYSDQSLESDCLSLHDRAPKIRLIFECSVDESAHFHSSRISVGRRTRLRKLQITGLHKHRRRPQLVTGNRLFQDAKGLVALNIPNTGNNRMHKGGSAATHNTDRRVNVVPGMIPHCVPLAGWAVFSEIRAKFRSAMIDAAKPRCCYYHARRTGRSAAACLSDWRQT